MESIKIINPGMLTTVQDGGRFGLLPYGLPPSGAMDQYSFQIGNILVGNTRTAAALETTFQGFEVQFLQNLTIAVTGADVDIQLKNEPAPLWRSFRVKAGDILSFGAVKNGLRSYLCVHGGIEVVKILGSSSTFVRGNIGSVLKKDDIIETCQSTEHEKFIDRFLPDKYLPVFVSKTVIRVMDGPQADYFTEMGLATFYDSIYCLSSYSDRQGCRTEGPAVEIKKGPGIITEPIPIGSIQVPGDGMPIILLRDCQVTGGYAKIAIVVKVDLDRIGQMKPGDNLRFLKVGQAEALKLWRERNNLMDGIESVI